MILNSGKRLFADSNVLIQGLLQPESAASTVIDLVASSTYELYTCREVIAEVKNALSIRLQDNPVQLKIVYTSLDRLIVKTRLTILPDPPEAEVKDVFDRYMSAMRHDADIPILAAALRVKPDFILSGNRQHFNDRVSRKCGIRICSCQEFLHLLARK